MPSRRFFLAQTAALAAAPLLRSEAAPESVSGLIDCNIHLGNHPNRQLPEITETLLEQRQIEQAWAGSFDALLQRDLAAVNARLARQCRGRLRAVGSLHPGLPAWRDDLKRCTEQHGMRTIRLYPGYHGYTLADPAFAELLDAAAEARLLIQIVAQLEDPRTQHPLLQVAAVDLKPLRTLLESRPDARIMVLNADAAMVQSSLQGCRNVWIDIAKIEGVAGVETLLRHWPLERVVFGSHAPFFYWQAAALKLQESDLSADQLTALRHGNARALIG